LKLVQDHMVKPAIRVVALPKGTLNASWEFSDKRSPVIAKPDCGCLPKRRVVSHSRLMLPQCPHRTAVEIAEFLADLGVGGEDVVNHDFDFMRQQESRPLTCDLSGEPVDRHHHRAPEAVELKLRCDLCAKVLCDNPIEGAYQDTVRRDSHPARMDESQHSLAKAKRLAGSRACRHTQYDVVRSNQRSDLIALNALEPGGLPFGISKSLPQSQNWASQ
jgi:hypothetical protein